MKHSGLDPYKHAVCTARGPRLEFPNNAMWLIASGTKESDKYCPRTVGLTRSPNNPNKPTTEYGKTPMNTVFTPHLMTCSINQSTLWLYTITLSFIGCNYGKENFRW